MDGGAPTLGLKVLRNGSDVLTKDGASLVVGGTTDLGASRFGEEPPNVERTFSGTSPEDFRILLAHPAQDRFSDKREI